MFYTVGELVCNVVSPFLHHLAWLRGSAFALSTPVLFEEKKIAQAIHKPEEGGLLTSWAITYLTLGHLGLIDIGTSRTGPSIVFHRDDPSLRRRLILLYTRLLPSLCFGCRLWFGLFRLSLRLSLVGLLLSCLPFFLLSTFLFPLITRSYVSLLRLGVGIVLMRFGCVFGLEAGRSVGLG